MRMLLMGMWMSLTKKPMKPMIKNPAPEARAILANSAGVSSTATREQPPCNAHSCASRRRSLLPRLTVRPHGTRNAHPKKTVFWWQRYVAHSAATAEQPPQAQHTLAIWLLALAEQRRRVDVELLQGVCCLLAASHGPRLSKDSRGTPSSRQTRCRSQPHSNGYRRGWTFRWRCTRRWRLMGPFSVSMRYLT
jgi:hypothetical protein